MQPMQKFWAPGVCCTVKQVEVTFQATAQPASQPWPEPSMPRFEYAIPALSLGWELGNAHRSQSRPVAQRWCGSNPRSSAKKSRRTTGPVTRDCVTAAQVFPRPFTE